MRDVGQQEMRRFKNIGAITASIILVGVIVSFVFIWSIDGYRYFALDRAILTKNRMLVGMLITLGSDPNGRDYDGEITPWEPNHPVMSATWNSDPKMIELIVSRGGDVDFSYGQGFSPLVYAVSHEDIDCVRTLVSLGANPEFLTAEGTAVAIASRLQNPEIIPLLTNAQSGPRD